ncbi:thermonuclease family protein [Azonexus sp. IMCC34839]|uniref:thermonuclease family protein n=1 Tax=Azonexus sp. IMCC34839 TaxID=3133695 RepID=UPI00399BFE4C
MKHRLFATILLAAHLTDASASSGLHESFEVTGSVIKNHDGDTITLLTAERGVINVRLSGADTPETGQAYWRVARDALHRQIADRRMMVRCYKQDWRKREVCHALVDGKDPALALVEQGLAWYAFMFADELTPEMRVAYEAAEAGARQGRIGLWQEPDPMPPWECRKLRKAHQKCR